MAYHERSQRRGNRRKVLDGVGTDAMKYYIIAMIFVSVAILIVPETVARILTAVILLIIGLSYSTVRKHS